MLINDIIVSRGRALTEYTKNIKNLALSPGNFHADNTRHLELENSRRWVFKWRPHPLQCQLIPAGIVYLVARIEIKWSLLRGFRRAVLVKFLYGEI